MAWALSPDGHCARIGARSADVAEDTVDLIPFGVCGMEVEVVGVVDGPRPYGRRELAEVRVVPEVDAFELELDA